MEQDAVKIYAIRDAVTGDLLTNNGYHEIMFFSAVYYAESHARKCYYANDMFEIIEISLPFKVV